MSLEVDSRDIQRLLEDERQRNAQHRENFQKLKEEHVRLQEDYVNLQKELKKALQTVRDVRSNQTTVLQKADKIIWEKDDALTKLRAKLDSVDVDTIRREAEEQLRAVFSKHAHELRTELETYRTALYEANLKITALKAEVENCQRTRRRSEEELKLKYRTELKQLQSELDELRSKDQLEDARDRIAREMRLQREQAQLRAKLDSAEAELRDLRNERDSLVCEARAAAHAHAERLEAAEESNRNLEFKLKSLLSQKEVVEQAASKLRTEMNNAVQQVVSLEEEKLRLKGQLAETERKHKAEVAELRLAAARQRAEIDGSRQEVEMQLAKVRLEAELALKTAAEQERIAAEKEQGFEHRLQAARAKDMESMRKLESKRLLLETQVAEEKAAKEQAEQRLLAAEDALKKEKASHERKRLEWQEEMAELRGKLKAKAFSVEDHAMRQRLQLLEEERLKDQAVVRDLEGTVQTLRSELQDAQIAVIRANEANEKATVQLQLAWEREKYDFVKRIDELESELRQAHKEHDRKLASVREKYKKGQKTVEAYKAKLRALKATYEEMEREAAQLRQNIPQDVHERVREELSNLRRRQLEFRRVIEAAPVVEEPGSEPCVEKLKDNRAVLVLKERVDHMDRQQQKHMTHMATLVKHLEAARTMHGSVSSSIPSQSSGKSSSSATSSSKSK